MKLNSFRNLPLVDYLKNFYQKTKILANILLNFKNFLEEDFGNSKVFPKIFSAIL